MYALLPEQDLRIYHVNPPYIPPTPPVFSPLPVSDIPSRGPRPMVVSYKTKLFGSPALMMCTSCQTQVTTEVTFKVGTYAWLVCLLFVFCGLFFGCCLIPFFLNHFKDAHHTCPHCLLVLHIEKRKCCH
uniref:LITAF domain-containing protein n=1 Tax=Nothobranchius furzeri TaxID=105023 RepID=A0A8C6L7I4_NOTFU